MTDAMLAQARMTVPNIDFAGWTSENGPAAIQGRDDGDAATPPLLALAEKAVDQGASGIIVGCFDDTAIPTISIQAPCPAIGIGQAAYYYCALRNWRFSVVTTLSVSVPVLEENIANYGLQRFLGKVRASEIPVLELEDSPEASAKKILQEARAALNEDQVDAIVLGCAGMVRVTNFLRERLPCPVIDPVEAAASCMTWLTRSDTA